MLNLNSMIMFRKIVVVDETGLKPWAKERLKELADETVFYDSAPVAPAETIARVGDADALLVSFGTPVRREVIEACPGLRYIGMCCSLYSEESANVDIAATREKGITVLGIRDYGDEGVVEYVVSELVRLLHGFGGHQWRPQAYELTGQKVGIVGLGRTGRMIADALRFFGAEVFYYNRSRKPEAEEAGIAWRTLPQLLQEVDILGTCLPRNSIVLHEEEFRLFGHNKILFNTSVGVTFEVPALQKWLREANNYFMCDRVGMGSYAPVLAGMDHVLFTDRVSGHSVQCMERLSRKVIDNVESFLGVSSPAGV